MPWNQIKQDKVKGNNKMWGDNILNKLVREGTNYMFVKEPEVSFVFYVILSVIT